MEKLSKPYLGEAIDLSGMFACRDSRQAFGHRFAVDKPNNDWIWTVAGLVVAVCAVLAFLAKLS